MLSDSEKQKRARNKVIAEGGSVITVKLTREATRILTECVRRGERKQDAVNRIIESGE